MSRCYPFPPPNLPRRGWGGAPAKPIELQNCLDAGKPETKKVKRGNHEKKEEEKIKRRKLNGSHLEDETEQSSCVTEDKEHQNSAKIFPACTTQDDKRKTENSSTVKCNGRTLRIWFPHKKTEPGIVCGSERVIHELENVGTAGKQKTELALAKEPANIVTANKKPGYPPPLPSKRTKCENIPLQKTEPGRGSGSETVIPDLEKVGNAGKRKAELALAQEPTNIVTANRKAGYPPLLPSKRAKCESIPHYDTEPGSVSGSERVIPELEKVGSTGKQKTELAVAKEPANIVTANKKPGYPPPLPSKRTKCEIIPHKNTEPGIVYGSERVIHELEKVGTAGKLKSELALAKEPANIVTANKKPGYPPPLPSKGTRCENIPTKQEVTKYMAENGVARKIEPETANSIYANKRPGYPPLPPKRFKHDTIPQKQEVPKMVEKRAALDSERAMPAVAEEVSTGSEGISNSAQFTTFQHGRVKRVEAQSPPISRTISAVPEKDSQMRNIVEKPPTMVEQKLNLSKESAEAPALPEIKACSSSQTALDISASKKEQKALKKLEKKMKKMRKRAAQYKTLMENWIPPLSPILEGDDDDEDWLFGSKQKSAPKVQPSMDGEVAAEVLPVSFRDVKMLLPQACYLPEAGIYALPYSIPF